MAWRSDGWHWRAWHRQRPRVSSSIGWPRIPARPSPGPSRNWFCKRVCRVTRRRGRSDGTARNPALVNPVVDLPIAPAAPLVVETRDQLRLEPASKTQMKTRILCSLAVALSGLGFTASADSPQLQTYLALARAQKALGINCPATPDCPVPCTVLERGKMQVKSNADCPPRPACPDLAKAASAKKLSKCPPSPACPHC